MTDGSERYHAKRQAGLSPVRRDGSLTSPETDRQAAAAERFAAVRFGVAYNDAVYATHGDGGTDFWVPGLLGVEVIWLGPRRDGHLIVNPHEPWRWADRYVVVGGSIEDGFHFVGYARHLELTACAVKDFGFGPRFAMPISRLRSIPSHALRGTATTQKGSA